MRNNIIVTMLTGLAVIAMLLSGCAVVSPTGQAGAIQPAPGSEQMVPTGKLQIVVTDAPAKEDISSIMVKIKGIEVHEAAVGEATLVPGATPVEGAEVTPNQTESEAGWTKVAVDTGTEFDLLKVKDNPETLGVAAVDIGTYTQIRLEVDTVKITFGTGDAAHTETATVPSGKIKFIQTFKVSSADITQLLFDFDAARSVNVTGNGKVMFKPVIKLTSGKLEGSPENGGKIKISPNKLADGKVGSAYSETLTATGGTAPYKWTLSAGQQLPGGPVLGLDSGIISGTPTAAGEFTFGVKVEDNASEPNSATRNFTIKVSAADLPTGGA